MSGTVARRLSILAVASFALLPVILFLGRARQSACPPEVTAPCDPGLTRPDWAVPAFWAVLGVGLVLALAAFVRWRVEANR